MRKALVIIAAVALAACNRTEVESHGEVVDTLNTPNIDATLGGTGNTLADTLGLPTISSDTDIVKKPVVSGRKPVDMKDSLRRP